MKPGILRRPFSQEERTVKMQARKRFELAIGPVALLLMAALAGAAEDEPKLGPEIIL